MATMTPEQRGLMARAAQHTLASVKSANPNLPPAVYYSLSISLSLYLSLSIFVYIYISIYLSLSIPISLSIYFSIYLSLSIPISLSIYFSIYLSLSIPISLSVFIHLYLSFHLFLSYIVTQSCAHTFFYSSFLSLFLAPLFVHQTDFLPLSDRSFLAWFPKRCSIYKN